mmetsp:Transcript_110257/g.237323  ORF Transcript_110257/g.237323 Transcript_110257/m.237323 type:complete len:244 (-) Transcript_110257:71-802(-)
MHRRSAAASANAVRRVLADLPQRRPSQRADGSSAARLREGLRRLAEARDPPTGGVRGRVGGRAGKPQNGRGLPAWEVLPRDNSFGSFRPGPPPPCRECGASALRGRPSCSPCRSGASASSRVAAPRGASRAAPVSPPCALTGRRGAHRLRAPGGSRLADAQGRGSTARDLRFDSTTAGRFSACAIFSAGYAYARQGPLATVRRRLFTELVLRLARRAFAELPRLVHQAGVFEELALWVQAPVG